MIKKRFKQSKTYAWLLGVAESRTCLATSFKGYQRPAYDRGRKLGQKLNQIRDFTIYN